MKILGCSCDLTYYTLDPSHRYFARVRAVSGSRTSPWKRTNAFSPQEGRWGVCLHPAASRTAEVGVPNCRRRTSGRMGAGVSLSTPPWRAARLQDGVGLT